MLVQTAGPDRATDRRREGFGTTARSNQARLRYSEVSQSRGGSCAMSVSGNRRAVDSVPERSAVSDHQGAELLRPSVGINTRSYERPRSEEHTSELQSQSNLVCRLLL